MIVLSRFRYLCLAGCSVCGIFFGLWWGVGTAQAGDPPATKLAPGVQTALDSLPPGDMLTVIVYLQPQTDLSAITAPNRDARVVQVVKALQAQAEASQQSLQPLLSTRRAAGQIANFIPFWIFNGFAITAAPETIYELAAHPDVARIRLNESLTVPAPPSVAPPLPSQTGGTLNPPASNIARINAPALWNQGFRGQGIVIATLDTGVDMSHYAITRTWRGENNSWFDPYDEFATPADAAGLSSGHGTRVLGVLIGDDAGGTAIGVAPKAQWIAAKIFNQRGTGDIVAFHQAFQWLLDPDGNPDTPDAPHVVNNSWQFEKPECNPEFELDLQALRAVGILPIFAAGNNGPSFSSSVSPANNPSAFAVGAIDNQNQVYPESSRGLSHCDLSVYPEVVAPGVNIRTTDLNGQYTTVSGTSIAAPHAAGVLALLLNAYPNLSAADQAVALIRSAVDAAAPGADIDTGYGRIDALAAYNAITDIAVGVYAPGGEVSAGRSLTYTIVVTNYGPALTAAVTVTDALPPGATFAWANGGNRGDCEQGGGVVTCTLEALPGGVYGTLGTFNFIATATVTIAVTFPSPGAMLNIVRVTSTQPDADRANNVATHTVIVRHFQAYLPVVLKGM